MDGLSPRRTLAVELLSDAKALLAAGSLRSAMSRAYYAVYHGCVEALEHSGYSPGHFRGRSGFPATRWEHGIVRLEFHREHRGSRL